jgi:hypothetical protein
VWRVAHPSVLCLGGDFALLAMTNGGTRATDALLALHYNNGKEKYEVQRTIPPGEQILLKVAALIHQRVADRKGRVLPADVTSGAYDVEDLNPGQAGNLMDSKLALDHTWGAQAIPDKPSCCGVFCPQPGTRSGVFEY